MAMDGIHKALTAGLLEKNDTQGVSCWNKSNPNSMLVRVTIV